MEPSGERSVGQLAASRPASVRVFQRHKIDFCCGGGVPLVDACAQRGLDATAILDEIREEEGNSASLGVNWADRPLPELIDNILTRHHRPLADELPRLEGLARKVLSVHGAKDPQRLPALVELIIAMRVELEPHMKKEERVLFPWILKQVGPQVAMPIRVMRMEHEVTAEQLEQLRYLTEEFKVPSGACGTWRALWTGLQALDDSLREHLHLENNILFPRALGE